MKAMGKLVALLVASAFAVSAEASILTTDDFNYPDGSLTVEGPAWVTHSGVAGDLLVSGGKAVVEHGVPSEDAHRGWGAAAGTIYYGIDFSVDDLGHPFILDATPDFEYFAHFSDGGTFNFRGRLDVEAPNGGGDYTVGIATTSSTADSIWATDLTYGVTYRAVVAFDQVVGQATLWIDAALDTDTSISGVTGAALSVTAFNLRQSDSDENETIRVDNLLVGTTFGDVAVVPEPATVALLGLGGLVFLRRRRN